MEERQKKGTKVISEEQKELEKKEKDLFLYKKYVTGNIFNSSIRDKLTHSNRASFWNAESRGLLFKIWLFKLHHYREKLFSDAYFAKKKVRYLNQEKSIYDREEGYCITYKDRFYSEYIHNFQLGSLTKWDFVENCFDPTRPEMSLSGDFWDKINQNINEAKVDLVYRGMEDVLRGDFSKLQLLKLDNSFGDLKDIFNHFDGSFLGVLKIDGGEEMSDYYLPLELHLDYFKTNLYMMFFKPNSKGVKGLQYSQFKEAYRYKFPFGLNFNFLDICTSYEDAIKILRTPPGENKWSKVHLVSLNLNKKLKNTFFEKDNLDKEYHEKKKEINEIYTKAIKQITKEIQEERERLRKKRKEELATEQAKVNSQAQKAETKEVSKKEPEKKISTKKPSKKERLKQKAKKAKEEQQKNASNPTNQSGRALSQSELNKNAKIAENKRIQRERKNKYKNTKKDEEMIAKVKWEDADPAVLDYGDEKEEEDLNQNLSEVRDKIEEEIEVFKKSIKKFCAFNEVEKRFEFFFYNLTSCEKFEPSFDPDYHYIFDIGYFHINLARLNPIHIDICYDIKLFLVKEFEEVLIELRQKTFGEKINEIYEQIQKVEKKIRDITIEINNANAKKDEKDKKDPEKDEQIQDLKSNIKFYHWEIGLLRKHEKEWYWNKYFDDKGIIKENLDELVDINSYEFQAMTFKKFDRLKQKYKYWACFGWDKKLKLYSKSIYNKETKQFEFSEFSTHKKGINKLQYGYPISKQKDYICYPCIDLTGNWKELDEDNKYINYHQIEKERVEESRWRKILERQERLKELHANSEYIEKEKKRQRKIFKRMFGERVDRMRIRLCQSLGNRDMHKSLQRIPGFNFKFTSQQLRMINRCPKRMIIIGRSGTGKSTCAILKMLAIDLLFIARKCILQGKSTVSSIDLQPTGIKHLFLTASRVLADDLKVFYNVLLENLREKLLGKELKKEVTVEKVVDTVKEMENAPQEFVENLQGKQFKEDEVGEEKKEEVKEKEFNNVASDESIQGSDLSEFENKDFDTASEKSEVEEKKPEEKKEEKEVEKKEEGEIAEVKENEEIKENKQEESEGEGSELDKSIEFEDDKTTQHSEGTDNEHINNLKKHTLAEIEEKLKNYNFRFDSFKKGTDYNEYPIFTTLIDFYQNFHMRLGSSGYLQKARFRLTTEKRQSLKKVGFNEYLDNYSNRRFRDINNQILEKSKFDVSAYKSKYQDNGTYYSRLVDARVFEEEFFPYLDEVYEFLKKKRKTYNNIANAIKEGRPMPFKSPKNDQKLEKDPRNYGNYDTKHILMHELEAFNSMEKYEFRKGMKTSNKTKEVGCIKFPEKYSKFSAYSKYRKVHTPSFVWNLMKNRESDEAIYDHGEYALQFILSVFDFWKRNNHCYELRDLAVLGGHSHKKTYWYWFYNWDGTRAKRITVDPYGEFKSQYGYGSFQEFMDFVYLDEIQDVSLKVILDLELISKYGFIGFGDNAQNITKGVSMKFEDLVDHMNNIDTLEEATHESRKSAKSYRLLREKREARNKKRIEGKGTKYDDRESDAEKRNNFLEDEIISKRGNDYRVKHYNEKRHHSEYKEILIPKSKDCVFVKLRKNFRSHSKILDLGNSIVRILEMLQRGDLDIMDDEISDMVGPKPMVFKQGQKVSSLVSLLTNGFGGRMTQEGRVRSGAEQVILVRDEEEKRNLPEVLKDMIVFTITESKGLEFQHVILYNFFSTSVHYQCWNYLQNADITIQHYTEDDYKKIMHQKELSSNGLVGNVRYFKAQFNEETGKYRMPSMIMDSSINTKNQELYNYINDELKALYVAITRAKNSFVVFDDGSGAKNRTNMDHIWKTLDVVDFIDKSYVEKNLKGKFSITKEQQIAQFKIKGLEFLRREQFEHAKKCFENLEHENAIDLCRGFILLEKIQKKEYYINMNQNTSSQQIEMELKDDYKEVGDIFVKAEKYQDAALCYFNAFDYIRARKYFEKSGMKREAAQMNYLLGHYLRASDLFYEIGDYYSCLICREMKGNPTDFLEILVKMFDSNKEKGIENEEKFVKLFERYMKRFLENLNNELYMELTQMKIEEELRKQENADEKEKERKAIKKEKENVGQELNDDDASVSGLGSFVDVKSRVESIPGADSFVDVNSKISNLDSFKILKESSEGRDSLAESFINLTFDENGKAQSVGDSAFLNIGFKPGDTKVFLEERVFSKILKFGSCFIDLVETAADRYKYKDKTGTDEQKELLEVGDEDSENEFDVDELTTGNVSESLIEALITYFIEWNLDELHWMFINKFKSKKNYRRMVLKLAEDYSIIGTSAISFSFKAFYNPRHYLSRSDQKRLTTLAFSSIFQRIPSNMLKVGDQDDQNAILSYKDINIMVMLGFMRQVLFLMPYEDNKELLTFVGEIDILGIVWCKNELKTQEERDKFITRAVNVDIFKKIQLICNEYYDLNLIEAALFKMFKFSFWDAFHNKRLDKILEFSQDKKVIEKLPFLTDSIKLLVEYQRIVALTKDKEKDEEAKKEQYDRLSELARLIRALLGNCIDREKLDCEYLEKYEVGIIFSVWFSFFNLKTPPNCPFDFGKNERKALPLFSEEDDKFKEIMLNQSRKLKRSLFVIYEKYCLDHQRFIEKIKSHDPSKNGFWSVFLVREVEPMKTKFFRGLGLHKYYIVHKLSQIAILTKELEPKEVLFLENSLELLAIRTTAFEKKVAKHLRLKEEEKLSVTYGGAARNHPAGVNAYYMKKYIHLVKLKDESYKEKLEKKKKNNILKISEETLKENLRYKVRTFPQEWKEFFKLKSFFLDKIRRMTYIMKHEIDPDLGYNTDGKALEISIEKKNLSKLKEKANNRESMSLYYDYAQIMKDCDISILSFDTLEHHNMYMLELIGDFLKKRNFRPQHVIDMFLICRRIGNMAYYSKYFKNYKDEIRVNFSKANKESGDLIFSLIDAEFSLLSGCANEFIETTIWILQNYYEEMRWKTFYNLLLRLLAVYNISFEGENKCRLYEYQVEYIEDYTKGGEIIKDKNNGLRKDRAMRINNCKTDVIKFADEVTQNLSNLLTTMVLSEEYSIDRAEELAYLNILQLRTDSKVSAETRELVENNYKEMTENLYKRINIFGDIADDEIFIESEEEHQKWIEEYALELRNPIFKSGNDLSFPIFLEIQNYGRNTEENLTSYERLKLDYVKQRAIHEVSLQTLRKYKKDFVKYIKFETKQQKAKERQIKTEIPHTLLSRTQEIFEIVEEKSENGETYYYTMLEILKSSLSSADKATELFLNYYTANNLLRNFVYVIDHYLTIVNTVGELLNIFDEVMRVRKKRVNFDKYAEVMRCLAKDFRNIFSRVKVVNITNAFKLKNKNTDFYENFYRKNDQEKQQVIFEYNTQKEIFRNMVRSYSTTKSMMKAFKKKYFKPVLEKRFKKMINKSSDAVKLRYKDY